MQKLEDIKPQQSIELLKSLHILTRDGKINQDSRRKLKQVYHLYILLSQFLRKLKKTMKNSQLLIMVVESLIWASFYTIFLLKIR